MSECMQLSDACLGGVFVNGGKSKAANLLARPVFVKL